MLALGKSLVGLLPSFISIIKPNKFSEDGNEVGFENPIVDHHLGLSRDK